MPNYIEYQQSISKELMSIKDRVRNFIDNHHWGEDGRWQRNNSFSYFKGNIFQREYPLEQALLLTMTTYGSRYR